MLKKIFLNLAVIFLVSEAGISFVSASTTSGTIDATYKYAWSENAGWLNFGTDEGEVSVTDSSLSGYAWSENLGWISLNCSNNNSCSTVDYGIDNDGNGNLSGYAWSENTGWIDFNPENGGVTINSSGEFLGSAWGENIGWIIFNCDTTNSCYDVNYKVKTDWRPQSARPACNNASDDDSDGKTDYPDDPGCTSLDDTEETDPSGGGGLSSGAYSPPTIPQEGFGIIINGGEGETSDRIVVLTFSVSQDVAKMSVSSSGDFSDPETNTGQIEYQDSYQWDLCRGSSSCPQEEYTVYARFYTAYGQPSETVSAKINLKEKKASFVPEIIKEIPQKISEGIAKIPEIIKEIITPKESEVKQPEVPIEDLVSKEPPLVFEGKWQLLSSEPIRDFVLAPLPKEIRELARKFSSLEKTFQEVGVSKITDLEKLKSVKLTLPGLTEAVGITGPSIGSGKFTALKGVPVSNLSLEAKQQLPPEIVFAKGGAGLIDYSTILSVNSEGEPQQTIRTVSGKSIQLVIKPENPVKSVKGYLVFKSKTPQQASVEISSDKLTASLLFAIPIFSKTQEEPVNVEEEFVLLEFEYSDPDGDGIYTANIQVPVPDGEYEVITVLEFSDPELGAKEIRLITVVDPEGYIFEENSGKETRIPGAIVSLFRLNSETKKYDLWQAEEYQQENPQTTDVRGTYSFLVPEGFYYLGVEAPGYNSYEGKPFEVKEGSGIHANIELKGKNWFLKILDWKGILLIAVLILLLYNFYRDKIREKILKR